MLTCADHHHEYFTNLCCLDGLMALPQNIRLQACNLQTFEAHSKTAKELLKAWYRLHEQINFLVSHSKSASRPYSMDQAKQYHLYPSFAKDTFATVPTLLEQGLAGADKASLIGIGTLVLVLSGWQCLCGRLDFLAFSTMAPRTRPNGYKETSCRCTVDVRMIDTSTNLVLQDHDIALCTSAVVCRCESSTKTFAILQHPAAFQDLLIHLFTGY